MEKQGFLMAGDVMAGLAWLSALFGGAAKAVDVARRLKEDQGLMDRLRHKCG